jgi:hypothetical protein
MKIVISSGHGKLVRGAEGVLDEVDEARKVVNAVAQLLKRAGVGVEVFHDDVSHSQSENLDRIVAFHNSKERELDVSVHFNAYETTASPMGCEVLYVTQSELAKKTADEICAASRLKNRGAKKRTDLAFLNGTNEPAILIETCFVDSQADADLYRSHFDPICEAISAALSGVDTIARPPRPERPPQTTPRTFNARGKASYFGGPNDEGVAPDEGLALISDVGQAPHLFLPDQPDGTSGLARRLNPYVHYIACRWDYEQTPKAMLVEGMALVRAVKTGVVLKAFPADWGPHEDTDRVADLSPSLMDDLGIKTDDEVVVTFPSQLT